MTDDEVRGLETRLLDPRPADLELLDQSFFEHGSSGERLDRSAVVAWLSQNDRPGYLLEGFTVTRPCDDVMLTTYVAVSPEGRRSLRSSLWKRGPAGWRAIFHQGTRCPRSTTES
jgi:ribonuclease HI